MHTIVSCKSTMDEFEVDLDRRTDDGEGRRTEGKKI